MIESVEYLNKMAKALIEKHFPEVITMDSHLHSDSVYVSLCNKCRKTAGQGLGILKSANYFPCCFFPLSQRSRPKQLAMQGCGI